MKELLGKGTDVLTKFGVLSMVVLLLDAVFAPTVQPITAPKNELFVTYKPERV